MKNKKRLVSKLLTAMATMGVLAGGVITPITGLSTLALTGGAMLAQADTAAASECGFNRITQTWKNCSNNGDYIVAVVNDPVTLRTFSQYVCVPAGQEQIIMPTYAVILVTKAGTC